NTATHVLGSTAARRSHTVGVRGSVSGSNGGGSGRSIVAGGMRPTWWHLHAPTAGQEAPTAGRAGSAGALVALLRAPIGEGADDRVELDRLVAARPFAGVALRAGPHRERRAITFEDDLDDHPAA